MVNVGFADVLQAARRLRGHVRPTPVVDDHRLAERRGQSVGLKLECWQRTGSFKVRGAFNRMLTLEAAERSRGVLAVSAGNHGQGVALAASELGVDALIVMPETTPQVKVAGVRRSGARAQLVGGSYDEAALAAERVLQETGRTFVHPFEDPLVIAGQGTVGLEIALEPSPPEIVLVPAGGGGLISGVAIAVKALLPGVRVYGVQSVASMPLVAGFEAGRLVPVEYGPSLADGLHGDTTAAMLDLVLRHVDGMLVVSEEAIARAMRHLFYEHRLVVEGSGAAPVAALMEGLVPSGATVAVLSGQNVDPDVLLGALERGAPS